ncbi:hypothetical protein JXQ70_07165 [bacterium]|nr:hypothetical protein [bacterium]
MHLGNLLYSIRSFLFWLALFTCLQFWSVPHLSGEQLSEGVPTIMPFSEVKPGMQGLALTVFQGYEVVEFPVEIIGTVPNIGPRKNMILARVGGQVLEHAGMIQGVSGSPVYIDGKLVGALSSSWAFSKDPIGGITPIEQMLEMARHHRATSGQTGLILPPDIAKPAISLADLQHLLTQTYQSVLPQDNSGHVLQKLTFPLAIAGCSESAFAVLKGLFEPLGFEAVIGGRIPLAGESSFSSSDASQPFEDVPIGPGSAVAVDLISGDMAVSAVGTVTHVQGDTLLAFGHPMFSLGSTELPLVKAYVHAVIPSTMMSFKLASTTQPIGTVIRDGNDGIMAQLSRTPDLLPLKVTVRNADIQAIQQEYNYKLVKDPLLTPTLSFLALYNTLTSLEKNMGQATLTMTTTLVFEGHRPICFRNIYSSLFAVQESNRELQILLTLLANTFERIEPESLAIDIAFSNRLKSVTIQEINLARSSYQPGDTLDVSIMLQPFQQPAYSKKISIPLPLHWSEGLYALTLTNMQGQMINNLRRNPSKYKPRSFEQLVRLLTEEHDQGLLYLKISRAGTGMVLRGEEYGNLPASMMTLFNPGPGSGMGSMQNEHVLYESTLPTDAVVNGSSLIQFEIRKRP